MSDPEGPGEDRPARGRPRPALAFAIGALAAVVAVVGALLVVVALPGQDPPSIERVVEVGTLDATAAAPHADPASPALLGAELEEVPFPRFQDRFGWVAAGLRDETVADRDTRTVHYERDGRRLAYTIVAAPSLATPDDALRRTVGGVELQVVETGAAPAVVLVRRGRTSVVSGDAGVDELAELATWRGDGAIPF